MVLAGEHYNVLFSSLLPRIWLADAVPMCSQALSITTVPRAQLSEGRERRRRLEDAFVALQPARASKDQSHDAAHCPGKAHDDSRQQEWY